MLFVALLAATLSANAGEPSSADAGEVRTPEQVASIYRQQAWELHRLAERDAWTGVERVYDDLCRLGIPLTADEYLIGANSAQAAGNLLAVRERLELAHAQREDREVIEWMFRLDQSFGRVVIVDERRKRPRLTSDKAFFMPDATRSLQYAISMLETGRFEGLLPVGTYHYGAEVFEVSSEGSTELRHLR